MKYINNNININVLSMLVKVAVPQMEHDMQVINYRNYINITGFTKRLT